MVSPLRFLRTFDDLRIHVVTFLGISGHEQKTIRTNVEKMGPGRHSAKINKNNEKDADGKL